MIYLYRFSECLREFTRIIGSIQPIQPFATWIDLPNFFSKKCLKSAKLTNIYGWNFVSGRQVEKLLRLWMAMEPKLRRKSKRPLSGARRMKKSWLVFSTNCKKCRQSHYREVARWEIFMEQELRFGLDLGWLGNFWGRFFHVFMGKILF